MLAILLAALVPTLIGYTMYRSEGMLDLTKYCSDVVGALNFFILIVSTIILFSLGVPALGMGWVFFSVFFIMMGGYGAGAKKILLVLYVVFWVVFIFTMIGYQAQRDAFRF